MRFLWCFVFRRWLHLLGTFRRIDWSFSFFIWRGWCLQTLSGRFFDFLSRRVWLPWTLLRQCRIFLVRPVIVGRFWLILLHALRRASRQSHARCKRLHSVGNSPGISSLVKILHNHCWRGLSGRDRTHVHSHLRWSSAPHSSDGWSEILLVPWLPLIRCISVYEWGPRGCKLLHSLLISLLGSVAAEALSPRIRLLGTLLYSLLLWASSSAETYIKLRCTFQRTQWSRSRIFAANAEVSIPWLLLLRGPCCSLNRGDMTKHRIIKTNVCLKSFIGWHWLKLRRVLWIHIHWLLPLLTYCWNRTIHMIYRSKFVVTDWRADPEKAFSLHCHASCIRQTISRIWYDRWDMWVFKSRNNELVGCHLVLIRSFTTPFSPEPLTNNWRVIRLRHYHFSWLRHFLTSQKWRLMIDWLSNSRLRCVVLILRGPWLGLIPYFDVGHRSTRTLPFYQWRVLVLHHGCQLHYLNNDQTNSHIDPSHF